MRTVICFFTEPYKYAGFGTFFLGVSKFHAHLFMTLCIFAFAFVPILAFGRIGDTPEQVKERYGEPYFTKEGLRSQCQDCGYKSNGMVIFVYFFNGISHEEQYHKQDSLNPLTKEEAEKILGDNSGNQKWMPMPCTNPSIILWELPHPELKAFLFMSKQTHRLEIATKEYADWKNALPENQR